MHNISDVSSEEELSQLLDDGKISNEEYNELLGAMRSPSPAGSGAAPLVEDASTSKRKQGRIALVLMFMGLIVPALGYGVVEMLAGGPNIHAAMAPWFFLGVVIEIGALVLGVISWPDVYGRATVITTSILAILVVIVFFYDGGG